MPKLPKDPPTKRTYQGERTFSFTCRDLPLFQPQRRIQKVESRVGETVGYVKLQKKAV